MKGFRIVKVAIVGFIGCALLSSAVLAGAAATYVPPREEEDWTAKTVRLVADKRHGFVPMTVNLTGMMEGEEGALKPLEAGRTVRLVVEAPFLQVQNSQKASNYYSDLHYAVESAGPAKPSAFFRELELRKPGSYRFRIQVMDPDGKVLSSNEVNVKAL